MTFMSAVIRGAAAVIIPWFVLVNVFEPREATIIARVSEPPFAARLARDAAPIPSAPSRLSREEFVRDLCAGRRIFWESIEKCLDPPPAGTDFSTVAARYSELLRARNAFLSAIRERERQSAASLHPEAVQALWSWRFPSMAKNSPPPVALMAPRDAGDVDVDLPDSYRRPDHVEPSFEAVLDAGLDLAGLRIDEAFDGEKFRRVLRRDRCTEWDLLATCPPTIAMERILNAHSKAQPLVDVLAHFPVAFAAGTAAVLIVGVALGATLPTLLLVGLANALIAVGYVLLADLSTDPHFASLRYLLVRQLIPLGVPGVGRDALPWLWIGHVAMLLFAVVARVISTRPVAGYAERLAAGLLYGMTARKMALIYGGLALAGLGAVHLAPGNAAAAEAAILVAAVALGHAGAVLGSERSPLTGFLVVGLLAAGSAVAALMLLRGDTGHAVLAAALVVAVAFEIGSLTGRQWALSMLLIGAATAAVALSIPARLELPVGHVDHRLVQLINPYAAEASDMARIAQARITTPAGGWPEQVPWSGLTGSGGLPLQAASDYTPTLLVMIYGESTGAMIGALSVLVCAVGYSVFVAAARRRQSHRAIAWLLRAAGYLWLAWGLRSLVSIAGNAGIAPLTGVTLALVSLQPVGLLLQAALVGVWIGVKHDSAPELVAPARNSLVRRSDRGETS